jgi:hypothetical protein
MRITRFFEYLGAPLKNKVWSWGACSLKGNDVVLRVWTDECTDFDLKRYVVLTNFERFGHTKKPGWRERLRHLEMIKQGTRPILVFCRAVDPSSKPRRIAGFDDGSVSVGGGLVFKDGNYWLEIKDQLPVKDYLSSLKK